ncbi:hypothetical protein Daus18300_006111 [Diaporthe australafricana]|uniref:AMP-binding enzyme C-terminal domain-containing protein n=1 Tax=Diaporthe australafricana TaxID=127596 RepID=A0ABR3WXR6_9PEZI
MPAVVESCIEKLTGAQNLYKASVVAVSHPEHGYEPFAVLRSLEGFTADQIVRHVKRCLGEEYSLFGVASLTQVGLTEFPVNATHKVIKAEVEMAVRKVIDGK